MNGDNIGALAVVDQGEESGVSHISAVPKCLPVDLHDVKHGAASAAFLDM
jgi:hypothetical protein